MPSTSQEHEHENVVQTIPVAKIKSDLESDANPDATTGASGQEHHDQGQIQTSATTLSAGDGDAHGKGPVEVCLQAHALLPPCCHPAVDLRTAPVLHGVATPQTPSACQAATLSSVR